MKLKKVTAILLCVLLLMSLLPTVSSAGVNGYFNVDYLEKEAAAAYGEEGLGAVYTPQATTWKVWSPTATRVQMRLYATGSDEEEGARIIGTYSLEQNKANGVWSITLDGDYKNVYYTYLVTARGVTNETRDIYARAAGVNGYRSMVVDLDETDPDGWDNDQHVLLDESTDAVIWEIHIRDFSISPTSGVSEGNRGKYLAFTEEGTTLNGDANEVSTCVNYLQEMGVNTVHLLPVYDFGSVDETVTDDDTNRNWGYDPINFNVPEGSYSTNPYDGNARITEFKKMVQALHEAGISVVMDVVYNHTYDVDSYEWGARLLYNNAFNDTVPGYYHRRYDETGWYNGSGCGNVTSSDKLMYRKYMIESVRYWAEEYHIDGFRFDLMGCHDVDTMNEIRAELDSLYGGEGKKILMYGEPWTGGDAGIANGATQNGAQEYGMNERVGMFSDWMRDAIKGDPDGGSWGWIQGDSTKYSSVFSGLSANDGRLSAPSQTVTYADAHDNLILWDKILISNGSNNWGDYSSDAAKTYLKQLNLAKTIVLMSQGMAFNVAGTEFGRSKQGNHNSYNAADSINAIDWTVRKTNAAYADYYKGLIQIREAFSPITNPDIKSTKYTLEGNSDSCIAVRIPNSTEGEWANMILILNDSPDAATVTLPEGAWTVVANGEQANKEGLGTAEGTYVVYGYGCAILVNNTAGDNPPPEPNNDYYLVGWINGRDYGIQGDSNNIGTYKFENGTLTATFTQDSYVLVKTGDNTRWYMCESYTQTPPATLKQVAPNSGEKLFVPGNMDVTFTLTENSDGTLTLDYITQEPENPDHNFYLNGWINGEQYNGNDYIFHEGSLTTQFEEDSYVMIRWGSTEYWTEGYPGNDATGAFFYPHSACTQPDKLRVPGGVEVTFTLSVLNNDTLNLTYTTAGGNKAKGDTDYYLFGWINGVDYGTGEDWQTIGDYKFVDGKLNASFTQDSYVAVKTGDNENWFMTDGPVGQVSSATLYNTTELGDDADKLYVPGCYEIEFTLTENEDGSLTLSYVKGESTVPAGESKDAVILHCWNWTYEEIESYLPQIKAAGYTAVQTSPAQPHSGYREGEIATGDWWMLYQPLGLKIAQEGESWLGSESELTSLCTAAHELGIEVIVDVVSNHICNGYNDIAADGTDPYGDDQIIATGTNWQGKTVHGYLFETLPDSRAKLYNPELFEENLTKYVRDRNEYVFVNDTNTEAVVHGNIGMPDFKTEDPVVQQSVLNYLKDLIDAGVDGFRFDAAKHIETPSDGEYASDFWPYIIGGAEEYAQTKGRSVWAYGEVLSTAGNDRKMNYYAPYIDMTEISYAYSVTMAIGDSTGASGIANQQFRDWGGVGQEPLAASSLVLMAESHDMYSEAENSFSRYSADVINKAWAIDVARADASALYFARPEGYSTFHYAWEEDQTSGYPIGTLGKCESFDWMDTEVAEANKFHNAFVGAQEAVNATDNYVVIERWNDSDAGAVIVNATAYGGAANVNAQVYCISEGKYYDQITGEEFNVSGGRVTGHMSDCGIAVLRKTAPGCDHPEDQRFTRSAEPTCTQDGFVDVYCGVCGHLLESTTIPALGHIDEDGDKYCDRCGANLDCLTVYFVDSNDWISKHDCYNNMYVYAYAEDGTENAPWPGVEIEIVGRSVDDHGIWKAQVDQEKFSKIIFNNGFSQTDSLSFVEDAKLYSPLVYASESASGGPEPEITYSENARHFDGTEKLYIKADAVSWWMNDDVIQRMILIKEDGSEESVDLEKISGKVFGGEIPAGDYVSLTLNRVDPNDQTTIYNSTGDIRIPDNGNFIKTFDENSEDANWGYYTPASSEAVGTVPGAVLRDVCGHTGFEIVRYYNQEVKICDCCGERFDVCDVDPDVDTAIFTDVRVNPDKWYTKTVYWAVAMGITAGTSDTTFSPDAECKREQVVTFLWAAAGKPEPKTTENPFTDVKEGKWYYKPVLWAVENGITSGTSDDEFGVGQNCTRAQVVTFLHAFAGKPEPAGTNNPFEDVKAGKWYYNAVMWAYENGVTSGTSETTFGVNDTCTRAQIVTFLYALMHIE